MTRVAPCVDGLRTYTVTHFGADQFLGIVGDDSHFNGYHLGPEDIPPDDYSVFQKRDVAGARLGNYATAIDVGVGWPKSREWFTWVVSHLDLFPDLVEVVGSRDGVTDEYWYWRDWTGWVRTYPWYGNHLTHYHLGFFRDAVFRDQTSVFTLWAAPGATTSVGPKPTLMIPTQPSEPPAEGNRMPVLGWRTILWAAAIGGMAWVAKRRREAGL